MSVTPASDISWEEVAEIRKLRAARARIRELEAEREAGKARVEAAYTEVRVATKAADDNDKALRLAWSQLEDLFLIRDSE